MPLKKLGFNPGVNRESTTYANEGGWYECNKIRFRSGQAEKIGGWVKDTGGVSAVIAGVTTKISIPPTGTLWGIARAMWNWLTLSGYNLLAIGTNLKYYLQNGTGGDYYDITPIRLTRTAVANAFTTINGSTQVRVDDPLHGAQTNDFVTISATSGPVNGIAVATMNGEYQITYIDSNSYYINVAIAATSSGTSTATATFTYQITTGNAIYTVGVGWGSGTWGGRVTGVAASTLSADINSSVTSIALVSATGFGTSGTVVIDTEIISYSGVSVNTLTGCVRGVSGTTAAAHTVSTVVQRSTTFSGWGQAATSGVGTALQMRLWSQTNFGENLIFCPRGEPLYYWITNNVDPAIFNRGVEIKAGTTVGGALVDSTCPSKVNLMLVSDASRIVIAFGCNDPTGLYATVALDPMQIRWSDKESYYTWTPAETNYAKDYRLSHGSTIVSAIQARQEILVFTDSSLYSMQFIGPPSVWGFQLLEDNISIAGPNAVSIANNVTYWMGMDKFFMYTGRVQVLPCTLREYVFSDINLSQAYQFNSGTNEGYNEVWWSYCSENSNVVDRYVIYNYLENIWYYGDWANFEGAYQGRTYWLDSSLRTTPMSMVYGTAGGSENSTLVFQETGTDDGTVNPPNPIIAYVQSSDFDIDDGHNYGFVWRLIPDLTFDGSYVNNPSADFTIRPRTFPGANYGTADAPLVTSAQNYATQRTYNVQQFTEQIYVRIRGRQLAFKVSSDTLGVQWQLGISRMDIRQDGRRS